jgi:hypothetical protein
MAGAGEAQGGGLRRVPGIDKARQARRDKVPMNADRYLKTPKVFGFDGVYKRLARHLDVVDDGLRLGEAHMDPYAAFGGADLNREPAP